MRRALRIAWTIGLGLVVVSAATLLMVPCALAGRAGRRFNREIIGRNMARVILAYLGVTVRLRSDERLRAQAMRQVVWISNHSSTLDSLVLLALGLPNTRFFLKRAVWAIFPMGLTAALMGTFFTMPQRYRERRVQLFKRAAADLRRSGESVFLSPEGTRVTHGGIGAFNRGAFHLAMDLGAPIVPLYIAIPRAGQFGKSLFSQPCRVDVNIWDEVDTTRWRLDTLEAHKERVRALYAEANAAARASARDETEEATRDGVASDRVASA